MAGIIVLTRAHLRGQPKIFTLTNIMYLDTGPNHYGQNKSTFKVYTSKFDPFKIDGCHHLISDKIFNPTISQHDRWLSQVAHQRSSTPFLECGMLAPLQAPLIIPSITCGPHLIKPNHVLKSRLVCGSHGQYEPIQYFLVHISLEDASYYLVAVDRRKSRWCWWFTGGTNCWCVGCVCAEIWVPHRTDIRREEEEIYF